MFVEKSYHFTHKLAEPTVNVAHVFGVAGLKPDVNIFLKEPIRKATHVTL